MKLNPQYLEKIASLTLDHYDQRAEEFWQGTRDHDVKQNIAALLQWIEGNPPFTILDFGCGPSTGLSRRSRRRWSWLTETDIRPGGHSIYTVTGLAGAC
jgi:predicted TPR repeat methyltransferase